MRHVTNYDSFLVESNAQDDKPIDDKSQLFDNKIDPDGLGLAMSV